MTTTTHTTESLAAQMAAMEKTLKEMQAAAAKKPSLINRALTAGGEIGGCAVLLFVAGFHAKRLYDKHNKPADDTSTSV